MLLSAIAARRIPRTLPSPTAPDVSLEKGIEALDTRIVNKKRKRHSAGKQPFIPDRSDYPLPRRETLSTDGIESEPSFAHDGSLSSGTHQCQGVGSAAGATKLSSPCRQKHRQHSQHPGRTKPKFITLDRHQLLEIEGICDLEIIQGAVLVLGAILRPSKQRHRIASSPPDQSILLRPIEGPLNGQKHQIRLVLSQAQNSEEQVNPGYEARVIHDGRAPVEESAKGDNHEELFKAATAACTHKRPVQLALSGAICPRTKRMLLKLVNALLTRTKREVILLELESGHSGGGLPGELSLYRLRSPLLTPAMIAPASKVWSVFYGENTPADSPARYSQCVRRLIDVYKSFSSQNGDCILLATLGSLMHGSALPIITRILKYIQTDAVMALIHPEELQYVHGYLNSLSVTTKTVFTLESPDSPFSIDSHQGRLQQKGAIAHNNLCLERNADRSELRKGRSISLPLRNCYIVHASGDTCPANDPCLWALLRESILMAVDISGVTSDHHGREATDASIDLRNAQNRTSPNLTTEGSSFVEKADACDDSEHFKHSTHWWRGHCLGPMMVNGVDFQSGRILFRTHIDVSVFKSENIKNLVFIRSQKTMTNFSYRSIRERWLHQEQRTQEVDKTRADYSGIDHTTLLSSRPWRVRRNLR